MLNPSTADAERDDATIRRCIALSRGHGFDALVVVNLFALRATDPKRLRAAADPVGAQNDRVITRALARATTVIAAWGTHGTLAARDAVVAARLHATGRDVRCLGRTQDGHPRHPLYVRRDAALVPFAEEPSAPHARARSAPKIIRPMTA